MFKKKIIWQKVFESEEQGFDVIPDNGSIEVLVGRRRFCMARYKGDFYAMDNRCPHQGAPLSGGKCNENGAIECPWHKYPFDLKTGRYTLGPGDCVETYPVEKRADGIYIGIKDWSWNIF